VRKLDVRLDPETDALLQRVARSGGKSAYARCAIIEKAARDEQRSEIDEQRSEIDDLRQELADYRARLEALERRLDH
jgi:chromosome segregation ATPase